MTSSGESVDVTSGGGKGLVGVEGKGGMVVTVTVTKKVRKVKEEIVDLFPRPVFSSQIPPPESSLDDIWHCGVAVSGHKLFGNERNCFRG